MTETVIDKECGNRSIIELINAFDIFAYRSSLVYQTYHIKLEQYAEFAVVCLCLYVGVQLINAACRPQPTITTAAITMGQCTIDSLGD